MAKVPYDVQYEAFWMAHIFPVFEDLVSEDTECNRHIFGCSRPILAFFLGF